MNKFKILSVAFWPVVTLSHRDIDQKRLTRKVENAKSTLKSIKADPDEGKAYFLLGMFILVKGSGFSKITIKMV
jgi:hypothetical protein